MVLYTYISMTMTAIIVKKQYFKNANDNEPEFTISYLDDEIVKKLDLNDKILDRNNLLRMDWVRIRTDSEEYKIAETNTRLLIMKIPQDFTDHLRQQILENSYQTDSESDDE